MALPIILWYLVISLLGLLTLPLAYRFFPALADRGYAFIRPLGLLLWAFTFWLLSSLGVLMNDLGGIFFALLLVAVLVVLVWRRFPEGELKKWFKKNRSLVITVEVLFLFAFVGFALFRALSPEITATEKPMELAFINAVIRSPSMPPFDPWLSGYAISYYYFGYVMVGMLAKVTAVSGGVAFNLGVSLVFAMTSIGAYGIVYNLLRISHKNAKKNAVYLALLTPLFVLVVSNAEGFLEYMHERGMFWRTGENGDLVSRFWEETVDIKDLENPPNLESQGRRFWWWWRGSRVVRDYGFPAAQDVGRDQIPEGTIWFQGDAVREQEVIDEFPFFSYFLADMHPHVLAMPFAFLAVALTLNYFLSDKLRKIKLFSMQFDLDLETLLLGGVVFGGLAFLNLWDFPIYVGLFSGAYVLKRGLAQGWKWARLGEFLGVAVLVGVLGALFYLPFYISFSSQAGGILPNMINPTRGVQVWVMFGTLIVPLFAFLLYANTQERADSWWKGLLTGLGFAVSLWLSSLLVAFLIVYAVPLLASIRPGAESAGSGFLGAYGGHPLAALIEEGASRRAGALSGLLTLSVLIGLALAVFWPHKSETDEETEPAAPNPTLFAALLILFGGLLVIGPEFFYLRDQFGTRMNTVFKFYIQAWLLWGVAAAYASAVLLSEVKQRRWSMGYSVVFLLVLMVGLSYPAYAINQKIDEFQQADRTLLLDGTQHPWYLTPDDHAAVDWLKQAPLGTLVEAVGGSYTHYARISAHSGQPALLGWPGHESQWRGGGEEMGSRQGDIEKLYTTTSWAEAQQILETYNIRYVYVGPLELSTYPVSVFKFNDFLQVVFVSGPVTVYEAPGWEPGN